MPGWGSTSPGLQAPSALKKRSCSSPALRAFMMPLLLTTSPLDTRHVSVPEQRHSQPSPPFKCKWAPSASSSGITSFQKGGFAAWGGPGTLLPGPQRGPTQPTTRGSFLLSVLLRSTALLLHPCKQKVATGPSKTATASNTATTTATTTSTTTSTTRRAATATTPLVLLQ